MAYRPTFQPQNPALSGYALGWSSCTSFASAMVADAHTQGTVVPAGGRVRDLCREPDGDRDVIGGTTLAQNDLALIRGWGIDLEVRFRIPWADLMRKHEAGQPFVLQGHGEVFEGTTFYCAASVNHAIAVPPASRAALDPAADGRRAGLHDARDEQAYPEALLRRFAARLILDPSTGRRLGDGYAYAMFGRDVTIAYYLRFGAGSFYVYEVVRGVITGRRAMAFSKATRAPCTSPQVAAWPGHGHRVLVRVLEGALRGRYVAVPQGAVELHEERG